MTHLATGMIVRVLVSVLYRGRLGTIVGFDHGEHRWQYYNVQSA